MASGAPDSQRRAVGRDTDMKTWLLRVFQDPQSHLLEIVARRLSVTCLSVRFNGEEGIEGVRVFLFCFSNQCLYEVTKLPPDVFLPK